MTHTGMRIRDRRLARGLSQMDLAAAVGISASYLNLIEHNRRRAGHDLIAEIARVLQVDAAFLSDGVAPDVVEGLHTLARKARLAPENIAQAIDLAQKFPAWARLLLDVSPEDTAAEDPHGALHAIVTGIGAASQALIEHQPDNGDWSGRFAQEIRQQTTTLHRLIRQLKPTSNLADPQIQVDDWLDARNGYIVEIENGMAPHDVVGSSGLSEDTQFILLRWLTLYANDVKELPLSPFVTAAKAADWDPIVLSRSLGVDGALVMRRLASLDVGPLWGLLVVDGSGNIMRHQRLDAVSFDHAPCPLLPVFRSEGRGHDHLKIHGAPPIEVFVQSYPATSGSWQEFPNNRIMLMRPSGIEHAATRLAGPGCRLCPAVDCAARLRPQIKSAT